MQKIKHLFIVVIQLDRTELGCLKAIVLYNPDIKQLDDARQIEELREKVYASLEAYGMWFIE